MLHRTEWTLNLNPSVLTYYPIAESRNELVLMVSDRNLRKVGRAAHAAIDENMSALEAVRGLKPELEASTPVEFGPFLDAMVVFKPAARNRPLSEWIDSIGVPTGTVVVMVHPYQFEDEALERCLRGWVQRGVAVLAVLFEGPTFGRASDDAVTAVRASQHFRSFGAETFVVTCGDSVEAVFAADRPARPARGVEPRVSGEAAS